jgi:hypothetical protein
MTFSANPVLFADDTSMIITKSGPLEFTNNINRNIIKINRWFKSNSLCLNIDKTHFLQFTRKSTKITNFRYFMKINKSQRLKT